MIWFLKKAFGASALLMGTAIVVWLIYNQFAPSPGFKRGFVNVIQLAPPLAMIWLGWRWLMPKPTAAAGRYEHFVFARILEPIGAMERGRKYADPLQESLARKGWGEVSGGGAEVGEDGQVAWVGLDLELVDVQTALEFTRKRLRELGAPPGSVLEYEISGRQVVLPIHET